MALTHQNLEQEISRLETELKLYKQLKLSSIERRINELLDQLDDPATPQTKGQRLRERLGIVAATVALTALTQVSFDIPLVFQQPVKQEQVSPKVSSALAKPQPTLTKPDSNATTKPEINRLMKAIASQESGGNHELINGDSGASGKWQVMPENIPEWSRAALGREVSHAEFMANPKLQQQIVSHRLNLYLNQQSTTLPLEQRIRMAASGWYSGQQKLWNNTRPQYSNGRRYPSIAEYTASVWGLYSKTPKFAETKAIIATWDAAMQADPKTGDMIAGYPVTSPRGMRISPTTGTWKMHQGIDFATPIGTPVIAIADGEIECDYWNDAGIVAMFTSDQFPNLRFDLLHLSKCNGASGSKLAVKQGDIIGLTGSYDTGPHLHLAIKAIDTNQFLRVRAGWLYWFIKGVKP